jgi:hypothetical protein
MPAQLRGTFWRKFAVVGLGGILTGLAVGQLLWRSRDETTAFVPEDGKRHCLACTDHDGQTLVVIFDPNGTSVLRTSFHCALSYSGNASVPYGDWNACNDVVQRFGRGGGSCREVNSINVAHEYRGQLP